VIDPRETARLVADTFSELPHIVELPGRGAGADMVGRTAAMLAMVSSDFAVQTVPTGWRRTSRPGVDIERAQRWLDEDFDAVAEVYNEYRGPFKLQLCGPLTWCSVVEDIAGEPSLRDRGFVADVAEALTEVARSQIQRLRRAIPGVTQVVVQIDEPALPRVIRGAVPTASGRGRVAAFDEHQVRIWFSDVVRKSRFDDQVQLWLHSCADTSHIGMATHTKFDGVSFDVTHLSREDLEVVGAAHDARQVLVTGVISPADWGASPGRMHDTGRQRSERLRSALGLSVDEWAVATTVTATCGLAGASAEQARITMKAVAAVAQSVVGETMPPADLN
jgi:hypothetical protein